MKSTFTRRQVLHAASGFALAASVTQNPALAFALSGLDTSELAAPVAFSFEDLQSRAAKLANSPYTPPIVPSPEVLAEIDYDQFQKIRYRQDKSVKLDRDGRLPVQLFHLGKYATEPVHLHVVEAGDIARNYLQLQTV